MTFQNSLDSLQQRLDTILTPEISALVEEISKRPGDTSSPYLFIPPSDLTFQQSLDLIASTSNQYAKACRLASLARAQYKIAEAAFKYKFRTSLGSGKNSAEREAKAYEAAANEHSKMILLEAIVELCEGIESSTRIASESSRRILLGVEQINKAEERIDRFESFKEKDFTPV